MRKDSNVIIGVCAFLLIFTLILTNIKIKLVEKQNTERDAFIQDILDDLDDKFMFIDEDINELKEQIDKLKNNKSGIDYVEVTHKDNYDVYLIPDNLDILNLTDDELESYLINTNDIDKYVLHLYDKNHVISYADAGKVVAIYNQNGFYFIVIQDD